MDGFQKPAGVGERTTGTSACLPFARALSSSEYTRSLHDNRTLFFLYLFLTLSLLFFLFLSLFLFNLSLVAHSFSIFVFILCSFSFWWIWTQYCDEGVESSCTGHSLQDKLKAKQVQSSRNPPKSSCSLPVELKSGTVQVWVREVNGWDGSLRYCWAFWIHQKDNRLSLIA